MTELLQDATFWFALATIIFFGLVWLTARKPIAGFFDSYTNQIKSDLAEATRLREDAEALLVETRKRQKNARAEAETILKQAEEQAEFIKHQAEKDLELSIKRREEQAFERIAAMEQQATSEIRAKAVSRALKAAENILKTNLSQSDDEALIGEQIKQIARG